MTPLLYAAAALSFYDELEWTNIYFQGGTHKSNAAEAFLCSLVGLWGGLVIGIFTEYFSNYLILDI